MCNMALIIIVLPHRAEIQEQSWLASTEFTLKGSQLCYHMNTQWVKAAEPSLLEADGLDQAMKMETLP